MKKQIREKLKNQTKEKETIKRKVIKDLQKNVCCSEEIAEKIYDINHNYNNRKKILEGFEKCN